MKRLNFKMVKDGTRTIIVLDGTDSDTDRALFRLLSQVCGLAPETSGNAETNSPAAESSSPSDTGDGEDMPDYLKDPETGSVQGLGEVPTSKDDIPSAEELSKMDSYDEIMKRGKTISGGPYKGMTATQVLERDRDAGLAALFIYARALPACEEREDISRQCRQFMFDLPNTRHLYPTRDDKVSFLTNASKLMQVETFINGYEDFRTFCDYASDDEVENVFVIATKALQERSTQNSVVK